MSDLTVCPVCEKSSITSSGVSFLLVKAEDLEIDVTDYDEDAISFSLDLSGSVTKYRCLDCNRVFYL